MNKLIFLTICFNAFSLLSFSQSTKELVEQGDKYYGKKDYKHALEVYLSALDNNPDDAAINSKIGLSYLYSETKTKAAKYISKAYRLNPSVDDQIDYHLGLAFQNTNEFQKAIEHFEEFKKKKKNLASIADKKLPNVELPTHFRSMN